MNEAVVIGIGIFISLGLSLWASFVDSRTLKIPHSLVLFQVITSIVVMVILGEWLLLGLWLLAWSLVVALGFFIGEVVEKYVIGFGDIKFILALMPFAVLVNQALVFILFLSVAHIVRALRNGGAFASQIFMSFLLAISFAFFL
jgi:hypothetical protein